MDKYNGCTMVNSVECSNYGYKRPMKAENRAYKMTLNLILGFAVLLCVTYIIVMGVAVLPELLHMIGE